MGWHDAAVHGVGFEDDGESTRLLLDVDYILRWVEPEPPSVYYSFFIAPATLVFENVDRLEADMTPANAGERTLLLIADIQRGEPESESDRTSGVRPWVISGHNFGCSFVASGFHQHLRRAPVHVNGSQRLSSRERGGRLRPAGGTASVGRTIAWASVHE